MMVFIYCYIEILILSMAKIKRNIEDLKTELQKVTLTEEMYMYLPRGWLWKKNLRM